MDYKLQKPSYYWRIYMDMNGHSFGSGRLKRACWRQYRYFLQGSIDDPTDDQDVIGWLESIASERVNNSKSTFYIYG